MTATKNIIQRKLPLNVTYTLVDKKYISLVDGMGCTCDNCGKLIANIATISNGGNRYNIGFDCLDTILLNNAILSEIDIQDYEAYKAAITKTMKLIKRIKEVLTTCKTVTGIRFEYGIFENSDFHTFYWIHNNNESTRDNDYVKIKGVKTEIICKIVSDYFKNLAITIR